MPRKKKMGRPTKFNEALARRILALAKEGKTQEQIAEEVGIGLATLKNWKSDKPDFRAAVDASRNVADDLVEAALFARATGYSHPVIDVFFNKDTGEILTEESTKYYPPDTAAATFWLTNRRKKRWQNSQKVDVTQTVSIADELQKARERAKKR